jgi:hypothetical protein
VRVLTIWQVVYIYIMYSFFDFIFGCKAPQSVRAEQEVKLLVVACE